MVSCRFPRRSQTYCRLQAVRHQGIAHLFLLIKVPECVAVSRRLCLYWNRDQNGSSKSVNKLGKAVPDQTSQLFEYTPDR
jgi:hypothetical protein